MLGTTRRSRSFSLRNVALEATGPTPLQRYTSMCAHSHASVFYVCVGVGVGVRVRVQIHTYTCINRLINVYSLCICTHCFIGSGRQPVLRS
jgi:hypothetical protein